jgi:hypothetical protein
MQVQLDAEPEPSAAPLFPFSRRSSRSRIPASFLLSGEWATVVTTALRCCVRRTSSLRLVVERRLPHRSTPSSTPVPKPSVVEHVIDRLLPSVSSLCRPSLSPSSPSRCGSRTAGVRAHRRQSTLETSVTTHCFNVP